jgi:hypothetical protein
VKKSCLIGGLVSVVALVGFSGPAIAVVDLTVKRAIVGVVLDNLGVDATDEFITAIAGEIDTTELDGGLVTAVTDLLDTGADPRSVIESQTDSDGDGVPNEGAALEVDDNAPNSNSTEKASNSDDKSENSSNRNPNGTSNSNKDGAKPNPGNNDDDDDDDDDGDEDSDSEDDDSSDEQDDD